MIRDHVFKSNYKNAAMLNILRESFAPHCGSTQLIE